MLKTIENHCRTGQLSVKAELVLTPNIKSLFYLGQRMMKAIFSMTSEAIANREMRNITALFVGYYP
jgi:hypothetical protein